MRWRRAMFILAGIPVLFAALVLDDFQREAVAHAALERAGYGEFVSERIWTLRCEGISATAFVSQGGRIGHDARGYVCTPYFGLPEIREVPLSDTSIGAGLSWE